MTIPIQLAIQGGGAKLTYLIAALEAVQALEGERLVRVTRIAGTSAGAIAGALYARGIDMRSARETLEAHRDELLRAFPGTEASLRAMWRLLWRRPFWDSEPLRRVLMKLLAPSERLRDLNIPLVIVAADLTNMQPCIYDHPDEPLISSLMDSAGIPFFFRTAPPAAADGYRVIVDGGVCENLPSDELTYSEEEGEVVGITFSASRTGAPLRGILGFARALLETALNASVLRAQLELGPNNFVIRTQAGSFDFRRAFDEGLGAEYRETRLLAEKFFRRYAVEARDLRERDAGDEGAAVASTELPDTRLHDVITPLKALYDTQQKPIRFELLSVRMIVTGASQASGSVRGGDDVRHEIVFRASHHPVSCYKIRLTSAESQAHHKTACEVFDRHGEPVPFELVPITDDRRGPREFLLFFREPIAPGDARAPVTLRVRETAGEALRLAAEGRDELLARASRADRPIGRVEIVVHLPDECTSTVIGAAPGSAGTRMSPAELTRYPAPAGFFSLGWKGEQVPPDASFGCHLVKR